MTRSRQKVYGDHRDDIGPACQGFLIAIEEMLKGGTAEDALRRRDEADELRKKKRGSRP